MMIIIIIICHHHHHDHHHHVVIIMIIDGAIVLSLPHQLARLSLLRFGFNIMAMKMVVTMFDYV